MLGWSAAASLPTMPQASLVPLPVHSYGSPYECTGPSRGVIKYNGIFALPPPTRYSWKGEDALQLPLRMEGERIC